MGSEQKTLKRHLAAILAAYLALTGLFAALGYLDRLDRRVRGHDSVYYFIYLPSLVFDGDLRFDNNLAAIYGKAPDTVRTEKGLAENQASIGPALLWSPSYLCAHLLSKALGRPATGYGGLYALFVYLAGSLYGLAGLFLTYAWLSMLASRRAALAATIAVLLASQLSYYLWPMAAVSHSVSFFATALFLFCYRRRGPGLLSGLCAGLLVITRWQNGLLLIYPLLDCLWTLAAEKKLSALKRPLLFLAAFLAGVTPQLLAWQAIYGRPLLAPMSPGFFDFLHPRLFSVLFSGNHGLFLWHPLLLIGLAGLAAAAKKHPRLAAGLFAAFLLQWYLNASLLYWHGSWGFGSRRFVHLLPVFALGLAALADRWGKKSLALLWALILFFGAINQLFIYQFQKELIFREGPLSADEIIFDKINILSLARAKRNVNRAVAAALAGDEPGFIKEANAAFEAAPGFRQAQAAVALSCMLTKNRRGCAEATEALHKSAAEDPGAALAYALALAREGKRERAVEIVDREVAPVWPERARRVRAMLASGPVLVNEEDSAAMAAQLLSLMTRDVDWGRLVPEGRGSGE